MSSGYDIQRGVYRVIDALEGDRRELARLQKKTVEMRKRQLNGKELVGEEEELRGLLLGASDLERKLQRALDEINRLNNKTDNLIDRQKQIDEQRRLKMLEEAKKNEALNLLIKDLESLDLLLKDLTEVRKEYMQAEGLFRKIQKMKPDDDQEDEMDTDEMTLDSIRVDTQSATDGILKTRENIAKVQDDYLVQMDEDIDIVAEEEYLKRKILDSAETVKKLSDDVDSFLKNQKEKYDGLMKKKALNDEEEKLRREKELQLQEELERERQRLENERKMREEEERRRREEEQRMRDLEDQDRLRAEEEEKRRQKELEDARKKKEMDEKMAQLQQMLDEEAEKNRAKQKQEILFILEGDTAEIERMKDRVLILVDKQKNIGTIKSKRRKLYTIPEENEIEDEEELKDLLDRTSQMFNTLSSSEKEIESLRQELDNCLPADVLDKVVQFEQRLGLTASELDLLSSDMDRCNDRHLKMLADGEKALEEEALRQQKLKEDEERLNKMKGEIDMMKFKDIQLRKNIATSSAKTEEEKSENDKDLSLLQNKKSDLSELENSIFDTSQDFEKWKDFTWNEEEETEMNRFGMVGSTSMPTFPEFLIQNPALREKIEARRMEMKRLQENIKKEAARMKEISEVLDEMDRKRREAELRRLAEQSMEWTQDYIPSGSAEFGAMPVFRSDFVLDPEEAKANAASRRASRTRESSVVPLEDLGSMHGYDDILLGYGARSRQQSVERSTAKEDTMKTRRSCLVDPSEIRIESYEIKEDVSKPNETETVKDSTQEQSTTEERKGRGRGKPPPIPKSSKK